MSPKDYGPLCYLKKYLKHIEQGVQVSGNFIFQWMLQKGFFAVDIFKDIVFNTNHTCHTYVFQQWNYTN